MSNGELEAQRFTFDRERYERELYDKRLQFEHELINRRLTWLLTSQSLLFAAYAFASDPDSSAKTSLAKTFLSVTPIAGVAISVLIFIGVLCGAHAKWTVWKRFQAKHPLEPFGVVTRLTYIALVGDGMLPVVFAGAWVWIRFPWC